MVERASVAVGLAREADVVSTMIPVSYGAKPKMTIGVGHVVLWTKGDRELGPALFLALSGYGSCERDASTAPPDASG